MGAPPARRRNRGDHRGNHHLETDNQRWVDLDLAPLGNDSHRAARNVAPVRFPGWGDSDNRDPTADRSSERRCRGSPNARGGRVNPSTPVVLLLNGCSGELLVSARLLDAAPSPLPYRRDPARRFYPTWIRVITFGTHGKSGSLGIRMATRTLREKPEGAHHQRAPQPHRQSKRFGRVRYAPGRQPYAAKRPTASTCSNSRCRCPVTRSHSAASRSPDTCRQPSSSASAHPALGPRNGQSPAPHCRTARPRQSGTR
jgi:hypothetical protein